MTRLLLLSLASGIFLGCYSTLDSFNKRMAKLGCELAEACHPDFAAVYPDREACRDVVESELNETFIHCTYDPERGRACIRAFKRRKHDCSLIDMSPVPECVGVVTCERFAADDRTLVHPFVHSLVAPGSGKPGGMPLDEAMDDFEFETAEFEDR